MLDYNLGVGGDSSIGIATHYGLGGAGIESRSGRDTPQTSRPFLWPTHSPIQWTAEDKEAGAWR